MAKLIKNEKDINEFVNYVNGILGDYMQYKAPFDAKIIDNNKWYESNHWDLIKGSDNLDGSMAAPVTSYLFNALAIRHSDAMDYFPEALIFEREENDKTEADTLSDIVPFILENNNFRRTYSKCWWYKLKHGSSCYGVFFNPLLSGGIGDIDIRKIDLLNLFWEPGVENIQDSEYVFLVSYMTAKDLYRLYPFAEGTISETTQRIVGNIPYNTYKDSKLLVCDCYHKEILENGQVVVHLTKFCGSTLLESTLTNEQYADKGIYDHGKYPFVIDSLFPLDNSPCGFGMIDLGKNPQTYIDKLDAIISKNALISGKMRFMVKDNGGVNEDELLDLSKDVIHVAGSLDEYNFKQLQANTLDPSIIEHRTRKIDELKEIVGNRDVNQGGTMSGVTGYNAIVALQEAGNKLSRDMIYESFESYKEIVYMCIEMIRQFYDEKRQFRILGNDGQAEYVTYSNESMKNQYSEPIFDIKVRVERQSPVNKIEQNQLAIEFFEKGFFAPENCQQALTALELMNFDGKDKIKKIIEKSTLTSSNIKEPLCANNPIG